MHEKLKPISDVSEVRDRMSWLGFLCSNSVCPDKFHIVAHTTAFFPVYYSSSCSHSVLHGRADKQHKNMQGLRFS